MPELPEVESIRRRLSRHILGKPILSVETELPRIVRQGELSQMVGLSITSIDRQGKYLVFKTNSLLILYAHLRMTGTFLYFDNAEDRVKDHICARWEFADGELLYRDVRTLGGLWVSVDGVPPWKALGLDPLDKKLTWKEFAGLLSHKKSPIKAVLLDQSVIAGVGNIYACEALFAAQINPRRPADEISEKSYRKLFKELKCILWSAIEASGTTFRDFRLSDGREGGFQNFLKVYGKAGATCPRCAQPIEKVVVAQRSAYFCPNCQK